MQSSGISLYWNDEELSVEEYNRKTKHYFCGKKLLRFDGDPTILYTILIVDLDDCYCANVYSDGEIQKLLDMHSAVPHKMKVGGQSAARFARIRDNEITLWFKRINEHLKDVDTDTIHLGISFVYKNRFLKHLHTYNKEKIKSLHKSEYGGLTGVYQLINKIENGDVA